MIVVRKMTDKYIYNNVITCLGEKMESNEDYVCMVSDEGGFLVVNFVEKKKLLPKVIEK